MKGGREEGKTHFLGRMTNTKKSRENIGNEL